MRLYEVPGKAWWEWCLMFYLFLGSLMTVTIPTGWFVGRRRGKEYQRKGALVGLFMGILGLPTVFWGSLLFAESQHSEAWGQVGIGLTL